MTKCGVVFHQRARLDVAVAYDAFAVAPAQELRARGEAAAAAASEARVQRKVGTIALLAEATDSNAWRTR